MKQWEEACYKIGCALIVFPVFLWFGLVGLVFLAATIKVLIYGQ